MTQNQLIVALFTGEAIFWLGAYYLIIRLAFQKRIHTMPVVAMCGNIAWEIILGLGLFPACPVYWVECPADILQVGTLAAAILDAVILFTILRYGRSQFKLSWLHHYFYAIVLTGVAIGFTINFGIMNQMYTLNIFQASVNGTIPQFLQAGLQGGIYTGWGLALIMGILFIAMNTSRPKMEGQSFYIAMFMFLGNLFAFFFDLASMNQMPTLLLFLVIPALFINIIYVVITYQQTH